MLLRPTIIMFGTCAPALARETPWPVDQHCSGGAGGLALLRRVAQFKSAVALFYPERHRSPTNDEALAILTKKTDTHPAGLISEAPVDPRGLGPAVRVRSAGRARGVPHRLIWLRRFLGPAAMARMRKSAVGS